MKRNSRGMGAALCLALMAGCGGHASTGTAGPPNNVVTQAWCEQLRTYQAKYAALQDTGLEQPDQQRSDDAQAALRAAQADTPSSVRSDIDVLVATLQHWMTAWQQSSYSISVIADPSTVLTASEVKALQRAQGHLDSFTRANC